ncbi:MAG: T9SS type A sorting domain-containing protein, partial [Candidatus Kapabacteria bacterium]|nr:T9SS type A sorting domain-containing protein [Candidatus Kapabacteria bacterium]
GQQTYDYTFTNFYKSVNTTHLTTPVGSIFIDDYLGDVDWNFLLTTSTNSLFDCKHTVSFTLENIDLTPSSYNPDYFHYEPKQRTALELQVLNLNIAKTDKCSEIQANCYCDDGTVQVNIEYISTNSTGCYFNFSFIKIPGSCAINSVFVNNITYPLTWTNNKASIPNSICINNSDLTNGPIPFVFTFDNNTTCTTYKTIQCVCNGSCLEVSYRVDETNPCKVLMKICNNCSTNVDVSYIKHVKIKNEILKQPLEFDLTWNSGCSQEIPLTFDNNGIPLDVYFELYTENGASVCPLKKTIINGCSCCPEFTTELVSSACGWRYKLTQTNPLCTFYGLEITDECTHRSFKIFNYSNTNEKIPFDLSNYPNGIGPCWTSQIINGLPIQELPCTIDIKILDKDGNEICNPNVNYGVAAKEIEKLSNNNLKIVEKDIKLSSFSAYPNPSDEYITLSFNSTSEGTVSIGYINLFGDKFFDIKICKANKGKNNIQIDNKDIQSGVYYINIKTDIDNFVLPISIIH